MPRSLSWSARLVLPICSAAMAALEIAGTPGAATSTGISMVWMSGTPATFDAGKVNCTLVAWILALVATATT